MPIKLTQVYINPIPRFLAFLKEVSGELTQLEVGEGDFLLTLQELRTKYGKDVPLRVRRIRFLTPGGELADNQYATQLNGYHWVKIAGYTMIKIAPDFIRNDTLTNDGIAFIQANAGVV